MKVSVRHRLALLCIIMTGASPASSLALQMAMRAPRLRIHRSSSTAGVTEALSSNAVIERGKFEAIMMPAAQALEVPAEAKARAGAAGSSRSKKAKRASRRDTRYDASSSVGERAIRALEREGVVQMGGVLSASTAAALRNDVLARRAFAEAEVEKGAPAGQHFGDVLLRERRCDLLLPLQGNRALQLALRELLFGSAVGADGRVGAEATTPLCELLVATLGSDAILFELAALVSEPGAPRQPVHPDNPYQSDVPLVTSFIALQAVSASMGPTTFLPGSHTAAVHTAFNAAGNARDALLQTRPCVVALLDAGDASCFDSRTLHCGGANANADQGGATRALFYFSFRNAHAAQRVGNVGSLRNDVKPLTLGALRAKLATLRDSDSDGSTDPFDDAAPEAEAARAYRQAAGRGDAAAQFNLGVCYRRGAGVAADAVQAVRWFREAAEQGLALAQINLGAAYYAGDGVAKNDVEAARWFTCAAEQGLPQAQQNLGWCYSQGVGVPKDAAQAAKWLQRAAGQGDLKAKELLGELLYGV